MTLLREVTMHLSSLFLFALLAACNVIIYYLFPRGRGGGYTTQPNERLIKCDYAQEILIIGYSRLGSFLSLLPVDVMEVK